MFYVVCIYMYMYICMYERDKFYTLESEILTKKSKTLRRHTLSQFAWVLTNNSSALDGGLTVRNQY